MPGAAIDQKKASRVTIDGREYTAFAGCNYLGLAHDPRVLEAACAAAGRFGLSTSASRETSGNTPIHQRLEERVTAFVAGAHADDARTNEKLAEVVGGVLVPDGYTANLAAAQGLAQRGSRAVVDRRAHASLADAARCAGMTVEYFDHLDRNHLATTLLASPTPAVVMTDGVFTSDGAIAPVQAWLDTLREGDVLLVDDCHGLGVLGGGRGACARAGVNLASEAHRLVYTSTLAKGLGGGGGIVIGGADFIGRVRTKAHAYVCTTPISPIVAAGTLAALGVLEAEPERVERLMANARRLRDVLGGPADEAVPICALPVADQKEGRAQADALLAGGVYVPMMSYPGGPTPWYFRASVTSEHTDAEIDRLGELLGSREAAER